MSAGKRGLKRVQGLKEELERIRKKIELARECGLADGKIKELIELADDLKEPIGEAIEKEAQREAEALKEEAARIKKGRKMPGGNHPGNKDDCPDDTDDDDDDDDEDDGNGNGNGNGDDKKKCCCCCKPAPSPASGSSVPDATCVYVRGETTVAAWSRAMQEWKVFDAGSPIVDVVMITGGILAVGERRAAIFDCKLGDWLAPYDSTETLQEGGGS